MTGSLSCFNLFHFQKQGCRERLRREGAHALRHELVGMLRMHGEHRLLRAGTYQSLRFQALHKTSGTALEFFRQRLALRAFGVTVHHLAQTLCLLLTDGLHFGSVSAEVPCCRRLESLHVVPQLEHGY